MRAAGTAPAGVPDALPTGPTPLQRIGTDSADLPFYAVEVEAYRPGSGALTFTPGLGTRPAGTLSLLAQPVEDNAVFRASDRGYVSRASDRIGQQAYPPLLETAFELDRGFALDPTQAGAGYSWGAMRIANPDGRWDGPVAGHVNDGRAVRVLFGLKRYDRDRGVHVDPAYADLVELFRGVQRPWSLGDATLEIPLRDASYQIERPIQSQVYSGAGGAEGTAELTGRPKPKTRGGTTANPVRNVTPLLIDPANRVYQYSDAPGTVVTLYERAAAGFTVGADHASYAALVAASVAPGSYATCNAQGLFRLGTTAAGQITADVTGRFPSAGVRTTVASIARYLLVDDMALPADLIDEGAFLGLDAAFPYVAGIHLGPEPAQGVDVVGYVLGSIYARLLPTRSGRLRPLALRAIGPGARPAATYGTGRIVRAARRALPEAMATPAYRWRVGYQRNHTPQISDLAPGVSDARRQFLASEYRYSTWLDSSGILTSYRRPNDPPPLATCLLSAADAQAVADALGALWGVPRRLFDVECALRPLEREIGDVLAISYPADALRNGPAGIAVGESLRTRDATVTLSVLV
jgi:hypothetical protein